MEAGASTPIPIFVACAQEDAALLSTLRSQLEPLGERGVALAWSERHLSPGDGPDAAPGEPLEGAEPAAHAGHLEVVGAGAREPELATPQRLVADRAHQHEAQHPGRSPAPR